MKLIYLTNLKRECVLVELPEGHALEDYLDEYDEIKLPNLLGKFTDLNEGDFEALVEEEENWYSHLPQYKDYYGTMACNTARESFLSAVEAEGRYTDNPFGEYPEVDKEDLWDSPEQDSQVYAALQYQIDKWQEAQEKVINLSNCYLFVKV